MVAAEAAEVIEIGATKAFLYSIFSFKLSSYLSESHEK